MRAQDGYWLGGTAHASLVPLAAPLIITIRNKGEELQNFHNTCHRVTYTGAHTALKMSISEVKTKKEGFRGQKIIGIRILVPKILRKISKNL